MATFLTTLPGAAPLGPYVAGPTSEDIMLGSKFVDQQGNAYRRALVGASTLVPGTLLQAPAEITNHQNLTPTAGSAIGSTVITATLGATLASANQYAEGYVVVTVTPGQGYRYRISSHAAVISGGVITINLDDPLLVALTTSSRIDLVLNQYSGVIINPTTATSCAVGAAIYPATTGTYTFIQTSGAASVLAQGTIVVGTMLAASSTTAGAVVAFSGVLAPVGIAQHGIATTEYGVIKLQLD
jgi:hypothetical protein